VTDIDPELLERLRHSGLRLDREGRWWHEGQPVGHPRLAQALHRWLDRLEDGRHVVRFDERQYAYVEVEDAPFVVRTLRLLDDGGVRLLLSDETEETLDPTTLRVGDDNALYCAVKGGRFAARLSRPAYYTLVERLEEDDEEGFVLVLGGRRWPLTGSR
jgi:hypothetical protein